MNKLHTTCLQLKQRSWNITSIEDFIKQVLQKNFKTHYENRILIMQCNM